MDFAEFFCEVDRNIADHRERRRVTAEWALLRGYYIAFMPRRNKFHLYRIPY